MRRVPLLCWLVVLLLAACVPIIPTDQSEPPTIQGEAVPVTSEAESWQVVDRQDATQPPLLLPEGDSYQLEPGWELASITYVYKWWGLGEPVFDMQTISHQGEGYVRGEEPVEPAQIAALLMALRDLYPTQQTLSATSHTDDYPAWQVELLGTDGRRILLTSQSNAYPDGAPWNVLHNGRLYAQYAGSIGAALAPLFPSERGVPAGSFWPEGMGAAPQLAFAAAPPPPQLRYGFDGLLPIADGFSYRTDPAAGTLTGVIEGRGSIGGWGNMVIGTLSSLGRVELTLEDGTPLPCTMEPIATEDMMGALWEFTCPVAGKVAGERYRLPITVEMSNDGGDIVTMEGVLYGVWGEREPILALPLPVEVERALRADPANAALLDAHPITQVRYDGLLETPNPLIRGRFTGELYLFGETTHEGRLLHYGVGTPFEIEGGKLTRWALSQEVVEGMLAEVLALPITQQMLQRAKQPRVMLGYAEVGPERERLPLMDAGSYRLMEPIIPACAPDPAPPLYPTEDAPLKLFELSDGEQTVAFLLGAHPPLVLAAWLLPETGLVPVLPPEGVEGGPLTFGKLSASLTADWHEVTLELPEEGVTESQRAYVEQLLPIFTDKTRVDPGEHSWFWQGNLLVTEAGELQLVPCGE